jgi:hypothetical protein
MVFLVSGQEFWVGCGRFFRGDLDRASHDGFSLRVSDPMGSLGERVGAMRLR